MPQAGRARLTTLPYTLPRAAATRGVAALERPRREASVLSTRSGTPGAWLTQSTSDLIAPTARLISAGPINGGRYECVQLCEACLHVVEGRSRYAVVCALVDRLVRSTEAERRESASVERRVS
ncbi:hypothetical protein PYCCODRAFT_1149586 [Trametes coccinea BRFM310]|uniref:Uncharacterized protein n=1 Tax=Trametes coccinea (strain BRFM310) TaxID=1353009 RepID=A0A1Y2IA59_TRAC3|nr:hypothetical protein PYCCODRAFT_1149586 [Trametes coccinea BRFM310]